jgi:hypothetical protein
LGRSEASALHAAVLKTRTRKWIATLAWVQYVTRCLVKGQVSFSMSQRAYASDPILSIHETSVKHKSFFWVRSHPNAMLSTTNYARDQYMFDWKAYQVVSSGKIGDQIFKALVESTHRYTYGFRGNFILHNRNRQLLSSPFHFLTTSSFNIIHTPRKHYKCHARYGSFSQSCHCPVRRTFQRDCVICALLTKKRDLRRVRNADEGTS